MQDLSAWHGCIRCGQLGEDQTVNLCQWADHLEGIAAPSLAGTPLDPGSGGGPPADVRAFIDAFRDELGHRRAVDRPLLFRLLAIDDARDAAETDHPDVELWWALHTKAAIDAHLTPSPGPLLGEAEFARGAIEATTETELSALHALSHHATREPNGDALRERMLDAARWHVDTLQPDNGTNHPWAIHVFLLLAEADPAYAAGAGLHAQGLLHNAIVRSGRPDRFSACVLLDASRALRAVDASS